MKICIIKLGAKGDVIRTLPVLPALKEKYSYTEISWITKQESLEIFQNNPYVKKVFSLPYEYKENGEFDILYNFDIEEDATKLASEIKADNKLGFCAKDGFPSAFNLPSEHYLNTLFDDELKKTNRKTYQEMMFEAAELKWKKQPCELFLTEAEKEYAEKFVENNKIKDRLIGIHLGAGSRWPSKKWHKSNLIEFIKKAKNRGYEILLFGGPNEIEEHEKLTAELEKEGIEIHRNNPKNSDREFFSLVSICDFVVCSDSFALHVSLALKKKTIVLFFCTSPYEVEGYGILKKVVSPIIGDFFPEKCDIYSEKLVKSISADEVLKALESFA